MTVDVGSQYNAVSARCTHALGGSVIWAAGKTYTMEGVDDPLQPDKRGLMLNVFDFIFDQIQEDAGSNREYLVYISYLQIYMENVQDLLAQTAGKNLDIGGDLKKGFVAKNLTQVRHPSARRACWMRGENMTVVARLGRHITEHTNQTLKIALSCVNVNCCVLVFKSNTVSRRHRRELLPYMLNGSVHVQRIVKSVADMNRLLQQGKSHRKVGSQEMNSESSRSHCIFTIIVECQEKSEDGSTSVRKGKLNLVDLAGSERQSKSQATGERLQVMRIVTSKGIPSLMDLPDAQLQ
jgi:hypothetical protein